MPTLFLPVQETIQSVTRPVVSQIVRDIQSMTRIPPNSMILYPGDIEQVSQPGSNLSDGEMERLRSASVNQVLIEVTEETNNDALLTTAVMQAEHRPIFYDDKIGVYMKPVYSSTNYTLAMKFRASSKTAALRWRDDIRARTSSMRDVNVHKASYSYLIPREYIYILEEIHRLRENVEGYGEGFPQYVVARSSTRLTEMSDIAGFNTAIGIAETQARVMGHFDFEGQPERGDKVGNSDIWEISFNYKFAFDKPIGLTLRYPVMVHNQILSEDYRPAKPAPSDDDYFRTYSHSADSFHYFEKPVTMDRSIDPNATLTLPWFDEFIPASIPSGTISVFNALCQLDDTNRDLLNIQELGEAAIDPDILEFIMLSEWPYMCTPYKSIMLLSLYRGTHLTFHDDIKMNAQGVVMSTNTALTSKRINHRVRFGLVVDLSLIDPDFWRRLDLFPKAKEKLIKAVEKGLKDYPGYKDLLKDHTEDIWDFIRRNRFKVRTVMVSAIIARDGVRGDKISEYEQGKVGK